VTRVLLGDHQVEVTRLDLGQGRLRLALRHLHPEVRELVGEQGQRLRHDAERRGLEHGQAQRAGDRAEG
jgi:hypothetical protein